MKIVIVGGGTSGWLTTLLFKRYLKDFDIVNISSKEIPTVGVGESTTYRFFSSLMKAGIKFKDIFLGCDGLPKMGINFDGWSKQPGSFIGDIDGSRTSREDMDYFFYYCVENNIPIEKAGVCGYQAYYGKTNCFINKDPSFDIDLDHTNFAACHIDNYAAGEFFKKVSIDSGVVHYESLVKNISVSEGLINSLELSSGEVVTADLYVDCTGFSKFIAKNLPDYEWQSYSKYLPLNSAIPFFRKEDEDAQWKPFTTAKTLSSGWMWEIPTRNRIGRGYVYDSNFISESEARKEVEDLFGEKLIFPRSAITFETGKQKQVYNKNCVSIGLSASFLEPLEATNIHCTIVQIENFINECIKRDNREKYNSFCNTLFDNMRDFVAYHYTGGKEDTPFWKYVNDLPKPNKVKEILELTKKRVLRKTDWEFHDGQAGQSLWIEIASGLGHINSTNCSDMMTESGFNRETIKRELESFHEFCEFTCKQNMSALEMNEYLKANK